MLTYHFDSNLQLPKYEHLYNCIKEDIIQKKLKPHDKLPSKRALAKHLQISHITVETAYDQLKIEGYIYSVEKSGYFVQDVPTQAKVPSRKQEQKNAQPTKRYAIDLKSNTVSTKTFPFHTWAKLTRQVLTNENQNLLIKAPQKGCHELRSEIVNHLYKFHGIDVDVEQVVVGAGTEYLYNIIIQLIGRDKRYALEDPGHKGISRVYRSNGIDPLFIPVDGQGMAIQQLESINPDIAHISPAHHFPTGITMPIQRRLAILKWAYLNQRYIIEDDYDSELRLKGNPVPPLFKIDQHEQVFYMNTFSKTLSPSLRIAYLVIPHHMIKHYEEQFNGFSCSVSSFEQLIIAAMINQGYFERHINRMRNTYKKIRDLLIEHLESSSIIDKISIKEEQAGLHFLIKYKSQLTDLEIEKKAQSLGLNVSTLSSYYQNYKETQTLVINYSGLDELDIPLTIQLLDALLEY